MSLWTEREISWVLENRWKQLARQTGGTSIEVDWMGLQREVEVGLARRMRRELQVEPLILCLVQPAPGGTPAYKGRTDLEPDSKSITKRTDGSVKRDEYRSSSSTQRVAKTANPETATKSAVVTEQKVATQTELPAGRTRRRRSAVA